MAENLRTKTYSNGDIIAGPLSSTAWSSTSLGAYAVFNNSDLNDSIYGVMYNFNTIVDTRGICPTGFHIPEDAEWTTLTDELGGSLTAGGPMKTTGTLSAGTGLWRSPNTGATNSSGFSGLPGGERKPDGSYVFLGYYGRWWSSTSVTSTTAYGRRIYNDRTSVNRDAFDKKNGFYVRCVKD
jgi:uncharacterized protein (TIGR02145 family)